MMLTNTFSFENNPQMDGKKNLRSYNNLVKTYKALLKHAGVDNVEEEFNKYFLFKPPSLGVTAGELVARKYWQLVGAYVRESDAYFNEVSLDDVLQHRDINSIIFYSQLLAKNRLGVYVNLSDLDFNNITVQAIQDVFDSEKVV